MRKVFEAEGRFIIDQSSTYYMPYAVEGKKGMDKVVNHAWRDTDLMFKFREAVRGKRVKVIVYDLDTDYNVKSKAPGTSTFIVRQYDKDLLVINNSQYFTTVKKVVIDLGDIKMDVSNGDGIVKVVAYRPNNRHVKSKVMFYDGEVMQVKLE